MDGGSGTLEKLFTFGRSRRLSAKTFCKARSSSVEPRYDTQGVEKKKTVLISQVLFYHPFVLCIACPCVAWTEH